MYKKFLAVFFALAVAVGALTTTAFAAMEGDCGETVTWSREFDGTVLTISGTGAMYDYADGLIPWAVKSTDTRLSTVIIEEGVTYIGSYSLRGFSTLVLADSIEAIGDYAFTSAGCDMESVEISENVTSIGLAAFAGCQSPAINVDEDNPNYTSEDGVLFNKDRTVLIQYPAGKTDESYTIPDGVTTIGAYAFYNCTNLTEVVISDSVKDIEEHAFDGCTSLASISISDSVLTIGERAFYGCAALTSVSIPDGVTTMGGSVFMGCSSLSKIHIGCGLSMSSSEAVNTFYSYPSLNNLTEITVDERNSSFADIDGVLFNKDHTDLILYPIGKTAETYEVPDGVETICAYAFYTSKNLTGVSIPDSVKTIGKEAFISCTYLSEVSLGNGITTIGESAFFSCDISEISIPDSVETIGDSAFFCCDKLTDVNLGNGVVTLKSYAFGECDSLTSITIPDSCTTLGFGVFWECNNLSEVILGNGLVEIGEFVFKECPSLTELAIPVSVTKIGSMAIYCDDIYYGGSEEDWAKIEIDADAIPDGAVIHFTNTADSEDNGDSDSGTSGSGGAFGGGSDSDNNPGGTATNTPEDNTPVTEITAAIIEIYSDVPENSWYLSAVAYVYENGIMKGISDTEFSPDSLATRAQLMTMLARIAGLDTDTGDTWYAVGMAWAIDSGVSDGSSPNVVITREQLVTMIYRYVGSPEVKGTLSFSDSDNVSDYALDAMTWAVENGIVEGIGDNTLAPQGNATRAQVAAILMRFLESIA